MRWLILGVTLGWFVSQGAAEEAKADGPAPTSWMQAALDNWNWICRERLRLPTEPLPWIIFYDERAAWHVAGDPSAQPAGSTTAFDLTYSGRPTPVRRFPLSDGKVWVPDRPPLAAEQARIFTAPYAGGSKSVVLCALPTLVQRSLGREITPEFSDFLLGLLGHEMAHTRQTSAVDARFKRLGEKFKLPASFDDNVIEKTFSGDAAYVRLFEAERDKLLTAALQDDEPDTGGRLLTEALAVMRERRAKFFAGDRAGYGELDDVFLTMEGIGQWVHFQILRRSAPAEEPWQKTAIGFLERTNSWVQVEGFALFILIERHVPNWPERFFAPDFPAPFEVLAKTLPAVGTAK